MIITPIDHGLDYIGKSSGYRSTGLHLSEIYNSLFKQLEPKRFDSGAPMNPMHLEMGLAWENMLEDGLRDRLQLVAGESASRPGEFMTEGGIAFSPDLLIYEESGRVRLGEIKLTWMSSRDMPRFEDYAFPNKVSKWNVQMAAYCVAPFTRLLTSDLNWVYAADIRPGQRLLAFDEHPTSKNKRRRWRHTTAEKIAYVNKPCALLTLVDGTAVTCSLDHQWLATKIGKRQPRWVTTQTIVDNPGLFAVCKPFDVWEPKTDFDSGYISGMFDGEGCLHQVRSSKEGVRAFRLEFCQLPGFVLGKMVDLMIPKGFSLIASQVPGRICRMTLTKFTEVVAFLGAYRPVRLLENFSVVDELPATGFGRVVPVASCMPSGEQQTCAIQTGTGTFIAEGIASHNCYHLELRHARLYAFFVNGEYAWMKKKQGAQAAVRSVVQGGPQLLAYDIEYSQRELDDNWAMLEAHGKTVGLLDARGRAITHD